MAFIRVKKIKKQGKEYRYAYIVENKWKKKKVRQKVKKYLGRVYSFERKASAFEGFVSQSSQGLDYYMKSRDAKSIVIDLIRWELHNHGFNEKEGSWVNEECIVDLRKLRVRNNKGAAVALEFNEGLLNEFKLKQLLKFNLGLDVSDEEGAYWLAKEFVENGIAIPQEVFVCVFGKIFK